MMLPRLDEHLDRELTVPDDASLVRAVAVLLKAGTCFAVIGGEHRIRMHERGEKVLRDDGLID